MMLGFGSSVVVTLLPFDLICPSYFKEEAEEDI